MTDYICLKADCYASTNVKRAYCADCKRERNLMTRYGLTLKAYNKLVKKQKHRCAICKKHEDDVHKGLHVDHDHNTGKVRGLLCVHCNRGVGLFGDTLRGVKRAYTYLRRHYARRK